MARPIQQIKQDLQNLEASVAEFAQEFKDLYGKYLEQLGQSALQQLILASYQLCTQIYPESFLHLSLNERQKLQKSLRDLGKEIKPKLLEALENKEQLEEESSMNLVEEIIKNLPLGEESAEDYEVIGELKISETDTKEQSSSPETKEIISQLQNLSSELNKIESPEDANPNNPKNLIRWQKRIEFQIKKSLDYTSREANKLLQDAGIIPNRLPSKILDVAIQAGDVSPSGGQLNHLANILNLAVETEKDKQQKPTRVAQISLLRLRLAEIEFSDATLNMERTQIRNLRKRIDKIGQQYRNKQRECAKAEAEAAWRSSWYEE